jgi:hypothetical protein
MSLNVVIKDNNTDRTASVNENHALRVAVEQPTAPEVGVSNKYRYLYGVLGSGGLNTGTLSQAVDGSSTAQEFYIAAAEEYDMYIMKLAIIIADGNISHNTFGGVSALPNGWDLYIVESGDTTVLVDKAKTSGQVIAQSGFSNPYGDSGTTWELSSWTGQADAHTITMPISDYVPGGLRLARSSLDKIVCVVNDNLTALDEFTVAIFGYKHMPA